MKSFTKKILTSLLCVLLFSNLNAAVLKIREGEGKTIIVTVNGKKYPQNGKVVTINNVPKGVAYIKVYSFRKMPNGIPKAMLIYSGQIFVKQNYIYRCTVDDFERMDVQEYCCVNQYGNYNYNNPNHEAHYDDYDDNDYDWDNNYWKGPRRDNNNNPYYPNSRIMNDRDFSAFKATITNSNFDSGKLTIMKTQLNNTRITSNQLRELAQLYSFESTKLDAAKYGATKVIDPQNLFVVYDVFDFESSKTSFANFISQNNLTGNNYNNNNNNNYNHHHNNEHDNDGYSTNGYGNYNWEANNGNGNGGYNSSMGAQNFRSLKQTLANTSMESTRLQLLQTQLANARITAGQLSELIGLFNFESNKLEAAKNGAIKVVDKQNLFTIYDSFSFESSKTEFANFISKL
jgi:hypothetical protein